MKQKLTVIILTIGWLLSANVVDAQTYLNVLFTNSSKKTVELSQLSKITFEGSNISFLHTDLTVHSEAMSDISTITFGASNGGSALPVELVSFSYTIDDNQIILKWETATEVNNYGFEIERSAVSNKPLAKSLQLNANSWEKIGFVQGHGNSNSPKEYSFKDSNSPSEIVKYRLKQISVQTKTNRF